MRQKLPSRHFHQWLEIPLSWTRNSFQTCFYPPSCVLMRKGGAILLPFPSSGWHPGWDGLGGCEPGVGVRESVAPSIGGWWAAPQLARCTHPFKRWDLNAIQQNLYHPILVCFHKYSMSFKISLWCMIYAFLSCRLFSQYTYLSIRFNISSHGHGQDLLLLYQYKTEHNIFCQHILLQNVQSFTQIKCFKSNLIP